MLHPEVLQTGLYGLVTGSLRAVSEAPTSKELAGETRCRGASDTAT
jgi:hypothetical protein